MQRVIQNSVMHNSTCVSCNHPSPSQVYYLNRSATSSCNYNVFIGPGDESFEQTHPPDYRHIHPFQTQVMPNLLTI